jgi:hypothetical protein
VTCRKTRILEENQTKPLAIFSFSFLCLLLFVFVKLAFGAVSVEIEAALSAVTVFE